MIDRQMADKLMNGRITRQINKSIVKSKY